MNLRFLFHLHFFLRRVQDDQNKMNALGARCVLVLLILSALDDLDVKNLHVSDGQDVQSWGVLDELLFQDVPILMNPNELDARHENCLVLSCA